MDRFLVVGWAALMLAACGVPTPTLPASTEPGAAAPTAAPPAAAPTTPAPTYVLPTLPPSPTPVCPGAPRTRLILHERGWVIPDDPRPVNVRRGPGTNNPAIGQIPARGVFMVREGPVCAGGFSWFRVEYGTLQGWIAEGDSDNYYVEPYLPG